MNTIISIVVAVLVFWLIITYLIPLLPSPLGVIVLILVVIGAIIWLLRLGGLIK